MTLCTQNMVLLNKKARNLCIALSIGQTLLRLFAVMVILYFLGIMLFHLSLTGNIEYTTEATKPERSKLSDFTAIHSTTTKAVINTRVKYVVVIPNSYHKRRKMLRTTRDRESLLFLGDFLQMRPDFDGAACLPSSLMSKQVQVPSNEGFQDENDAAKYQELFSLSWCRYARREWSVQIRNSGEIKTSNFENPSKFPLIYQLCNITNGAFILRKEKLLEAGLWNPRLGKLAMLDFFMRFNGTLKIAKIGNCFMSDYLYRKERGRMKGEDFSEYAAFGNQHKILRIIQEDRVEWTTCVANADSCKEQPYTPPKSLPEIGLPICCSVVLGGMLQDIVRAMNAIGVEYRITFGTLLGAVRNQAIIPWTRDIDLAIRQRVYYDDETLKRLERYTGGRYYIGWYKERTRVLPLRPAQWQINTTPFFKGSDDLIGEGFFSNVILRSVNRIHNISTDWRDRGYIDFYVAPESQWDGPSTVMINNETHLTFKDPDRVLRQWYGAEYLQPVLKGRWEGLSDIGESDD